MSPFVIFALLFLILLYAFIWHDKPASQHLINKHPADNPGTRKKKSRTQPMQTDNSP